MQRRFVNAFRPIVSALGLAVMFLFGCGDSNEVRPPPQQWVSLFDPVLTTSSWRALNVVEDPFGAHRPPPEEQHCPSEQSYRIEAPDIEIDTGVCNYVTLVQPARFDLHAGDTIRLVVWHYALTATQPAQAHVAIQLAAQLIWERFVAIPSSADLYEAEVRLLEPVARGAPVYFHLHNHGVNQWRLQPIDVRAED